MDKKISQLTAKGANLAATDLLEISEVTADGYASKYVTGAEVISAAQTGMQEELISGTNIKTINSTSLLGSGDVDVQPTLISGTNIKTINGNTLLGSGDLVISTGLTIGTTAITSGTVGRILFEGTGNVLQESANLFWDNTNSRLGIGGSPSTFNLDVVGTIRSLGVSNFRGPSSSNTLGTNLTTTAAALFYQNTFNGVVALGGYANSGGEIQSAQNGGVTLGGSLYIQRQAGNVIIGSSTDAGFKLDVNGTARVQGRLTVSTSGAAITSSGSQGFEVFDQYGTRSLMTGIEGSGGIQVGNSSLGSGQGRWVSIVQASSQTSGYGGIRFFNDNAGTSRIGSIGIVSGVFNLQTTSTDVSNQAALIATSSTLYLGYQTYNTLPSSAAVAIQSTTQGFLPPRMTTTQRNAIASPASGLIVYDTTDNKHYGYNGTAWTAFY